MGVVDGIDTRDGRLFVMVLGLELGLAFKRMDGCMYDDEWEDWGVYINGEEELGWVRM